MDIETLKGEQILELTHTLKVYDFETNDGEKEIGKDGSLKLKSRVYKYRRNIGNIFNDSRLYLEYNYALPSNLTWVVEATVSDKQFYGNISDNELRRLGITNKFNDPRLTSGALLLLDDKGGSHGFVVTEKAVYVFEERMANYRTPDNYYHAYAYMIPVAEIASDKVLLNITWIPDYGFEYYVDHIKVLEIPKEDLGIGLDKEFDKCMVIDLGGKTELPINPTIFKITFGTFMKPDILRPHWSFADKAIVQLKPEYEYYYPYTKEKMKFILKSGHAILGQGNEFTIHDLKIKAFTE